MACTRVEVVSSWIQIHFERRAEKTCWMTGYRDVRERVKSRKTPPRFVF